MCFIIPWWTLSWAKTLSLSSWRLAAQVLSLCRLYRRFVLQIHSLRVFHTALALFSILWKWNCHQRYKFIFVGLIAMQISYCISVNFVFCLFLTFFQLNATYLVYYITVGSSTCWVGNQQRKRMVVDPVHQYQKLYLQLYELLMMGINARNM